MRLFQPAHAATRTRHQEQTERNATTRSTPLHQSTLTAEFKKLSVGGMNICQHPPTRLRPEQAYMSLIMSRANAPVVREMPQNARQPKEPATGHMPSIMLARLLERQPMFTIREQNEQ